MNTSLAAFDQVHRLGERATHPRAHRLVHLSLSLLLAGTGPLRRRFEAAARQAPPRACPTAVSRLI